MSNQCLELECTPFWEYKKSLFRKLCKSDTEDENNKIAQEIFALYQTIFQSTEYPHDEISDLYTHYYFDMKYLYGMGFIDTASLINRSPVTYKNEQDVLSPSDLDREERQYISIFTCLGIPKT